MPLNSYQMSLTNDAISVTLGDGTDYHIDELTGLLNFSEDAPTQSRGLAAVGSSFIPRVPRSRTVTAKVIIRDEALPTLINDLRKLQTSEIDFNLRLPELAEDLEVTTKARLSMSGVFNYKNIHGYLEVTLTLICSDPRFFDINLSSAFIDSLNGVDTATFDVTGTAQSPWFFAYDLSERVNPNTLLTETPVIPSTYGMNITGATESLLDFLVLPEQGAGSIAGDTFIGATTPLRLGGMWDTSVVGFPTQQDLTTVQSNINNNWNELNPGSNTATVIGATGNPSTVYWRNAWL